MRTTSARCVDPSAPKLTHSPSFRKADSPATRACDGETSVMAPLTLTSGSAAASATQRSSQASAWLARGAALTRRPEGLDGVLQRRLRTFSRRRNALEGARHHDELRHFKHRIDVGPLDKSLRHAIVGEVEFGGGRLVAHDAGIIVAFQLGAVVEREDADGPDLTALLRDHSILRDGRRPGVRIEQDARVACVEHRIAVDADEHAGLFHVHAAILRVDGSVRRLQRQPALPLDGDVERILGLDRHALSARDEGFSLRNEVDGVGVGF